METEKKHPRYRMENDRVCIDLNVRRINQLFDSRDPSPFLERDLDDDAVDYIVSASLEQNLRAPLTIVIHISESEDVFIDDQTITDAVHNHFAYAAELARRLRSRVFRQGEMSMVIGVILLSLCLSLAQALQRWSGYTVLQVLREGLVIFGWVAMWRPIDLFLYSWWPQMETLFLYQKLSRVPVVIRRKQAVKLGSYSQDLNL